MDDRTAECILECMATMADCMADKSAVDGLSPALRARLSRVQNLILEEHPDYALRRSRAGWRLGQGLGCSSCLNRNRARKWSNATSPAAKAGLF